MAMMSKGKTRTLDAKCLEDESVGIADFQVARCVDTVQSSSPLQYYCSHTYSNTGTNLRGTNVQCVLLADPKGSRGIFAPQVTRQSVTLQSVCDFNGLAMEYELRSFPKDEIAQWIPWKQISKRYWTFCTHSLERGSQSPRLSSNAAGIIEIMSVHFIPTGKPSVSLFFWMMLLKAVEWHS